MGAPGKQPHHPAPNGPEVEFYLGRNVRDARLEGSGTPILTVRINDYPYELRMGEKNKAPREVYQALLDSRSRTIVPDWERAERVPRPGDGLGTSGMMKYETMCDYEVALIKEGT